MQSNTFNGQPRAQTFKAARILGHTKRVFGRDLTNAKNPQEQTLCTPPGHEIDVTKRFPTPQPKLMRQVNHSSEAREIALLPEWDRDHFHSDTECVQYMTDIMGSMRELEQKTEKERCDDFLARQSEVAVGLREMAVEWMIRVHYHLNLNDATLHGAVALMDRILRKTRIQSEMMQILSLLCVWVASKYHDSVTIEPRHLQDIINCPEKDFLVGESFVVQTVDYQLTVVTPLSFAQRYIKAMRFGLKRNEANFVEHFIKYLLEFAMCNYSLSLKQPSEIAATCVVLCLLFAEFKSWSIRLEKELGYSVEDLTPNLEVLAGLVNDGSKYLHIRKKYSASSLSQIDEVLRNVGFLDLDQLVERSKTRRHGGKKYCQSRSI